MSDTLPESGEELPDSVTAEQLHALLFEMVEGLSGFRAWLNAVDKRVAKIERDLSLVRGEGDLRSFVARLEQVERTISASVILKVQAP